MSIFKGSRYTNTSLYQRDNRVIFRIREMMNMRYDSGVLYEYTEGDTLDGLAFRYYGDAQLWWVILEANAGYRTPMDIKHGDEIFIPDYEEVMKYV